MSVQKIASRYAKSLVEFAQEKGQLDAVASDMKLLKSAASNRDFYLMLKSPIIHLDKKEAIIKQIFSGKMSDLTIQYLNLVISKSREEFLPEIADEYISQYKSIQKVTSVTIVTAQALSQTAVDAIKNNLISSNACHPNLEITVKIDPELIGGYVLEFDNKRYDASIQHKLSELKAEFVKNLYVKEF
jgi:F-type H+-transporting ATPase subunit delta